VPEGGSAAHHIVLGVVDGLGRPQAAEVRLVLGSGRGDAVRAEICRHLDRETADAAGASHEQEHLSWCERGGVQGPQGGHARHRQGRRVCHIERGRPRGKLACRRDTQVLGIGPPTPGQAVHLGLWSDHQHLNTESISSLQKEGMLS